MSGYDEKDFRPSYSGSGNLWSLAAFSAAVLLCSLLGAKVLSTLVEKEQFARAAYGRVMREAAARAGQSPESYAALRGRGVDHLPTGTIRPQPAPMSPCGEEKFAGGAGR